MFRVTIVAPKGRVADNKIASKEAILGAFRGGRISRTKKPTSRKGREKWGTRAGTLREPFVWVRLSSQENELGLDDFFQRRAAADHHGGTFQLNELSLLEFGEQAADGFAGGADGLGDFFVGQG
jgi:hypothetical protein